MKKISQRQAHANLQALRRLENQVEQQRQVWSRGYPGGVHLGTIEIDGVLRGRIEGTRMLSHAIVCVERQDGKLFLYALPASKL